MTNVLQQATVLEGLGVSPTTKRVPRRPAHTFHLRQRPFTIQPFCIAPVLPGETLKNALLQSRVVTDPIQNPLIGWWQEYYVFYVKLRQMGDAADYEEMLIDFSKDMSSLYDASADVYCYHNSGLNYTREALNLIVDKYFRSEGETTNVVTIDGMPCAKVWGESWLNSVQEDADVDETVYTNTYADIDIAELDTKYQTWLTLRAQNMVDMDFDDYLASFGVRKQDTQQNDTPELLRFIRDWQYPTNTIDPSDGSAASAVSWAISERIDKDRFFNEPGFVFGVTISRPKVYVDKQRESASHLLEGVMPWLPAVLSDKPETSLQKVTGGNGPLGGLFATPTTNDYWVDIKDLFMHGDQFCNFAMTETDAGMVALPTTDRTTARYPTEAEVEGLFVDSTDASGKTRVRQDGVINFNILGKQTDTTPR